MSGAADWLVQALAASALLMAAVLAVRGPVRRLAGPQAAYALWALPALRLLLPRLPATWQAAAPVARAGESVTVMIVGTAPAAATPATSAAGPALLGLWAAGAVLLFGWQVARHRRFCRRLLAGAAPVTIVGGIAVVASAGTAGPLAFGCRRRVVVLPADWDRRYDPAERALALAHELAHHRRRDLHANWAALVVLALHWFDPIAWLAFRAFRADQELATDARVLAGRSAAERHAYAAAIVKAADARRWPAPAACFGSITILKRRLHMLSTTRAPRSHAAVPGAAVALLVAAGLALTAPSARAAAALRQVGDTVQATPTPPAQPTAPVPPVQPLEGLHQVKRVAVVRNGRRTTYAAADIDAHLAAGDRVAIRPLTPNSSRMILKMDGDPGTRIEVQYVPAIRSARCGIGNGSPAAMTVDSVRGVKRMIVICTDRIEAASRNAAQLAADGAALERGAMASARTGLATARASIEQDRALTDAQRTQALAGIAQAERELDARAD